MKLENFQYRIRAAREGKSLYRVLIEDAEHSYSFRVHESAARSSYLIVISDSIGILMEEDKMDEALLLREQFSSIFRCHRAAIDRMTENQNDFVEVYVP